MHVAENFFLRPTTADPHALKAALARRLEEQLTVDDRSALHARAVLDTSDQPADEITRYAKQAQIDLIVMGTHGRDGPGAPAGRQRGRARRANRVVSRPHRQTPGARIRASRHRWPTAGSEAVMIALKKILVATDFSEPSDAALAYGRELARTFGASLTVLHIVDNILTRAYGAEGVVLADPELQREIETSAQRQVDAVLFDEDRKMLGAVGLVITSNSPSAAIVTYARDASIDLIVMGTHGRGAIAQLLMGSVAERVVRIAPCPVLTVRHPEHEFVLPDALVAVAKA
jgi:nucleotide-binding universal stress UspA family protein